MVNCCTLLPAALRKAGGVLVVSTFLPLEAPSMMFSSFSRASTRLSRLASYGSAARTRGDKSVLPPSVNSASAPSALAVLPALDL